METSVRGGDNEFAFVPAGTRRLAAASLERGIKCTLAAQIRVQDHLTVWCQQHNPLTLAPADGRNYEMAAEVSSESAEVMQFLMSLSNSSPAIIASVDGAADWFKKSAIYGFAVRNSPSKGRVVEAAPGAGPIWPRYCEIGTNRPIFGDCDKTIHDTLSEISIERRRGYSWYNGSPKAVLNHYTIWRASLGLPTFRNP